MIKKIDDRWTCTSCGYLWSKGQNRSQIPDECECETRKNYTPKQQMGMTLDRLHFEINTIYTKWDEGEISTEEAYKMLKGNCQI